LPDNQIRYIRIRLSAQPEYVPLHITMDAQEERGGKSGLSARTKNGVTETTHTRAFSCRLGSVTKRKTSTTDSQPAPAAGLRREGRLARIAKALASGATVTDIAEAEGISRTLASTVANSPECRQLIAEFVSSEFDEMRAIFYRCLRAIEHAMSARREYMTKEGQIVYGGPDHYARLAATKHFRDFLGAGRPAPKLPEKQQRRGMTLQELEELVASSERSRSGANVAV
jgi:hypothetical protein